MPGQLLLKFRPETSIDQIAQMSEGAGFLIQKQLTPGGLFLIVFSDKVSIDEMQARLRKFPAVLYVEPNRKIPALRVQVSGVSSATFSGQVAPAGAVVAVLDAGFELPQGPPNLRIYQNSGEIAGDGLDNDGNGYVDDVAGYDFFDGDNNPRGQDIFKNVGMRLIEAVLEGADDKTLVILPLRVGPGPWLLASSVCEAISYASARGAAVVNLSFGGWWGSEALLETTAFAAKENTLLIAAAGDGSENWLALPRRFPQVIWVSSVQEENWKRWLPYSERVPIQRLRLPAVSDITNLKGTGNHLMNHQNVNSVKGQVNEAVRFIRTQKQYLQARDSPGLSMGETDFTLAAWVYLDSKEEASFVSNGGASRRNGIEYCLRYHPPTDRFEFAVGNLRENNYASVLADSYGPPATGVWSFVAAWFDRSQKSLHIQVNGGPVDSNPQKVNLPPEGPLQDSFDSPFLFTLGRYSNSDSAYLDGRMDEVGIWKRILTQEERADLYNNGKGNSYRLDSHTFQIDRLRTLTQGLTAYYPLNVSDRYRWRIGSASTDPLEWIGLIGIGLFVFSSIQGISLQFKKR